MACETEVAVRGGVQVVIGMVRSSLEECPFGSQGGRVMSADMMTVGKFQEIITAGGVRGCRSGQMAKNWPLCLGCHCCMGCGGHYMDISLQGGMSHVRVSLETVMSHDIRRAVRCG